MRAYTEDEITSDVTVKRLHDVPGWEDFQDSVAHIESLSYLYDAGRFAHKVYAQLDAFESDERYVVWLDADTVIKKPFDSSFLENLLNDKMCAYLGRKGTYTETGFLIFDTEHEDFPAFEKRYREMYDDRILFMLMYWIDCCAFDTSIQGLEVENLTPDAAGMVDVFSLSPLADYIEHNKGQGHGKYRERELEQVQAAT